MYLATNSLPADTFIFSNKLNMVLFEHNIFLINLPWIFKRSAGMQFEIGLKSNRFLAKYVNQNSVWSLNNAMHFILVLVELSGLDNNLIWCIKLNKILCFLGFLPNLNVYDCLIGLLCMYVSQELENIDESSECVIRCVYVYKWKFFSLIKMEMYVWVCKSKYMHRSNIIN